jgi:hypothetical protein
MRWREVYVTRSTWRVTECSVPDRRWEQMQRRVTECEQTNSVISINPENPLDLALVINNL